MLLTLVGILRASSCTMASIPKTPRVRGGGAAELGHICDAPCADGLGAHTPIGLRDLAHGAREATFQPGVLAVSRRAPICPVR